jgi:hypothetical protein
MTKAESNTSVITDLFSVPCFTVGHTMLGIKISVIVGSTRGHALIHVQVLEVWHGIRTDIAVTDRQAFFIVNRNVLKHFTAGFSLGSELDSN